MEAIQTATHAGNIFVGVFAYTVSIQLRVTANAKIIECEKILFCLEKNTIIE